MADAARNRRGPLRRGPALLLLLAAGAFLAVPALMHSAPARESAGGGRVVIGVRGDVTSFNLYTASNAFSQEVIDLLDLKLAAEQDDFQKGPPSFRPALASSWEFSPDRRTLTFHLRTGARWSDGNPLTSADVLFTHQAAASPEVAWVGSDVKELIDRVSAPDAQTVVYHFSRAYPYALMDAVEGNVVSALDYGKVPFPAWPKTDFLRAPVSSGPFLLKRYERGALIELGRNPGYLFAPLPRLDAVVFRVIPDETTLVNELLAGGIDFMENVPADAVPRIEAAPGLRILRVPDLSYTFIGWNTARPLFSDARVRRALTMAIDRQAIIEGLLPGTGRPSNGPVLSFLWAHDDTLAPLPYDPAAARRLLAEAGWKDSDGDGIMDREGVPFRFDLETNQGSGLRADVVRMAAGQLRKVGVEATPRVFEFGAFIARHEKHDFDAFVSSWRESTKVELKSAFHSASIKGGYNYGSYARKELDAIIDRARGESDPRAARDLWRRAQRLIHEDQPYTFLFERDRLNAFRKTLDGVRPSPRSAYVGLEEWRWEAALAAAP